MCREFCTPPIRGVRNSVPLPLEVSGILYPSLGILYPLGPPNNDSPLYINTYTKRRRWTAQISSLVGREILSVNVGTWNSAVFDGESVLGDRTVGVEVESHGGADPLEAALVAQPHVRTVALCHGEVVVLA